MTTMLQAQQNNMQSGNGPINHMLPFQQHQGPSTTPMPSQTQMPGPVKPTAQEELKDDEDKLLEESTNEEAVLNELTDMTMDEKMSLDK